MNKRTVMFIVGGLLVLLVLIGLATVPKIIKENGPTPTPTATLAPTATPGPSPTPRPTEIVYTTLKVYGGLIFQDKAFVDYMHDKYHIDIDEKMMGSFAQADADLTGIDCTVPGSQSASDYFDTAKDADGNLKNKGLALSKDTIMRTYIVIYSWKTYLPALMQAGLVTEENGTYLLKMKPIVDAMAQDKTWRDIGVDIPGPVNIGSTDPLKSSSGMVFMGMIADYSVPGGENGNKVVTASTLPATLPALYRYWENQGLQVADSPGLFKKFLESGPGMPFIVNYESAFPNWYAGLSDKNRVKADEIVGLYPEVTVNTDHILISLTPACQAVRDIILNDPWVMNEAWTNLGMRNPLGEVGTSTGGVRVSWLRDIVASMSEPKKDVSDAIQAALK